MTGFGMQATRAMASKRPAWFVVTAALVVLQGCGPKEDNSPEMGAVPPKPNFSASAHAPNSSQMPAKPGADAEAMGQMNKKR